MHLEWRVLYEIQHYRGQCDLHYRKIIMLLWIEYIMLEFTITLTLTPHLMTHLLVVNMFRNFRSKQFSDDFESKQFSDDFKWNLWLFFSGFDLKWSLAFFFSIWLICDKLYIFLIFLMQQIQYLLAQLCFYLIKFFLKMILLLWFSYDLFWLNSPLKQMNK